jgi:alkylated DNA repair dioxygenase AlkB
VEIMSFYFYTPNAVPKIVDVSPLFSLDWIEKGKARKEYWWSSDGRPYTYGKEPYSRTYESQEWQDIFAEFIDPPTLTTEVGIFVNYYEDGRNSLGWHADDDPTIDHSLPILVYSFGGERAIQFCPQNDLKNITEVFLEDRSLLVMMPGCQQNLYHRIPKVGKVVSPRVSVTVRHLI